MPTKNIIWNIITELICMDLFNWIHEKNEDNENIRALKRGL